MAETNRGGRSCHGSARQQIIERQTNPLYYDILNAFERESGLPVLVNTSFNVHEEPIVNKPSECIRALLDGRIDFPRDQAVGCCFSPKAAR
jgi:predicted NodU family carbamoyl transferase